MTFLKVKEWWGSLASREKKALTGGGFCLSIFLIYQGWWSPLNEALITLRKRIHSQQKTLIWMEAADKVLLKYKGQETTTKSISLVALLSALQKQIIQFGLEQQLKQLKQASPNSIEVHFQKVEFDKLMQFMLAASKNYQLTPLRFSVVADSTPGIVNADILLSQ